MSEFWPSIPDINIIFDNLPGLIWVSDTEKKCIFLNKAWLSFRGKTMEQELDEGWTTGIHPDDLEMCLITIKKCFDNRTSFQIEYRLKNHEGLYKWILDEGVPNYDNNGNFTGYIGTCLDITDKKIADEKIKESEELFQNIFRKSTAIMLLICTNTGAIKDANKSAVDFYGYSYAELTTMNIREINLLNHETIKVDLDKLKSKININFLRRHRLADGSLKYVSVNSSPIPHHSNPLAFSIITDITEKLQLDEQLIKTNRLFNFSNQINELLLNSQHKDHIIDQFTHLSTTVGNFTLSVAFLFNEQKTELVLQSVSGNDDGFSKILNTELNKAILNNSFTDATIFTTKKAFFCNDLVSDTSLPASRESALIRGYGSYIFIPLLEDDILIGCSILYTNKINYFSLEEYLLLNRISLNINQAFTAFTILEKKKIAEENLTRIIQAVEQSPNSVLITDIEGKIEYVNSNFIHIWGNNINEFLGEKTSSLNLNYHLLENYHQEIRTFLYSNHKWSKEIELYTKNGERIWTNVTISPIQDNSQQLTNILVNIEDISDKKLLQEKLNEKHSFIEAAQSIAQLGTFSYNVINGYSEKSANLDGILGIDASYIPHKHNFYSLLLPEFVQPMKVAMSKCRMQKIPFEYKFKMKRPDDGSIRWMQLYGVFDFESSENGEVLYSAIQDITERENALNERKRIIDSINDNFYVLDKNVKFLYYNKKYAKNYLNIEDDSYIGKSLYQFFPFLQLNNFDHYLQTAFSTGLPQHFDMFLNVDGYEDRWFEQHMYPFEGGCTVLFRDISKQKVADQYLLQLNEELSLKTKELSSINVELERFAYVASHDLQEPLRMVTSFLKLFEAKYKNMVDEKGKEYITIMTDASNRMKNLIQDILTFSKIGVNEPEITSINMNELVQGIKLWFKNEIEQCNATLIWDALPVIKAEKITMQQLLQNLIGNALKYKSHENPIIKLSYAESKECYTFSVQDNGIGIDPKYTDKIFQLFQRLHTRKEYSGTGIGLSICKKIIERMKGEIWVESSLGKGSTFKFTIPKIAYPVS